MIQEEEQLLHNEEDEDHEEPKNLPPPESPKSQKLEDQKIDWTIKFCDPGRNVAGKF